jgi:RimJ/RimL family protein N-acetyltransferase
MQFTAVPITDATTIHQRRAEYLRALSAPLDGWWEGTSIARSAFWAIRADGHDAGHCCLNADNVLLRFSLTADYQPRATAIFDRLLVEHGIGQAIVSTSESPFFAQCLDRQRRIVPHSYLFRDARRVPLPPGLERYQFRQAHPRDLAAIVEFYRANADATGDGTVSFLRERLDRDELFGLYDGARQLASGECIPSRLQPPYADLGMVVAREARGQGFARTTLIQMKDHCYTHDWQPICSCAADNAASKRAIEHAGFSSNHRLVTVSFVE